MKANRLLNQVAFILPALLVYTLFQFYPIISGFYYGMTDWNGLSPTFHFVGMENFRQIFADPLISKAAVNTLKFTVLVVLLQNGLALLLALLVDRKLRGVAFFRAVYFIPVLISTAVVGFIWSSIFNPIDGAWKAIFQFLGFEGLARLDVLGSPKWSLYAVVFVTIWQYLGYSMVIYLAGLQTIARELYEAADIDGAGRWQQFRHVTFPLLAPSLTINLILSTIGCLKQFEQVFVLTGGGPGDSSQVVGTAIYTVAFNSDRYGYGVALSTLMFVVIAVISIVQLRFLKRRELEQ